MYTTQADVKKVTKNVTGAVHTALFKWLTDSEDDETFLNISNEPNLGHPHMEAVAGEPVSYSGCSPTPGAWCIAHQTSTIGGVSMVFFVSSLKALVENTKGKVQISALPARIDTDTPVILSIVDADHATEPSTIKCIVELIDPQFVTGDDMDPFVFSGYDALVERANRTIGDGMDTYDFRFVRTDIANQ